jgi:hypothetical protein
MRSISPTTRSQGEPATRVDARRWSLVVGAMDLRYLH